VHDHTLAGLLLARGRSVPTVATAHGPLGGDYGNYLRLLGRIVQFVAISEAQRRADPRLNWVATVHNAVPVGEYRVRPAGDGVPVRGHLPHPARRRLTRGPAATP
jgi:hypothetical protein